MTTTTTDCTCDPARKPEPIFAGCLQHDAAARTPEMIEADLDALRRMREERFARLAGIYGGNLDYEQDRR